MPVLEDILQYVQTREPHEVRGYVSMPTGSGKTVIFAAAIKQLDVPALVLVPTKQLVDQTIEQLKHRLPDKRIESHVGWRRDVGQHDVLVATYAAVARKTDGSPFSLVPENYQLVVMDEAHRSMGTMSRRFIDERMHHAMHLGFTATEDYNDKRRLSNFLYDEVHKISVAEAVELGMISPYIVASLHTDGDMSKVTVKIDDYDQVELSRVMERPERNAVVLDYYAANLAGEKAMFNVNTVKHAEDLAEGLRERGVRAAAISGSQPKREQKALLRALHKGDIMALAQAKLLGEGFDEPSLAVVINVTPTMSFVRSQQRSGRALRLDPERPDKVALIIECVDDNYVKSPAYFGDDHVAGSYGVDGFVDARSVTSDYRSAMPDYQSPEEIIAANTLPQSKKSSRVTRAQREKERRAFESIRRRREQKLDGNFEESDNLASDDFMHLDIEEFCASNPIANYIVNGVDIGDAETSYPNMRAALGQLAGSDVLEQGDVMTRYVLAQKLYTEVEQKSAHALGDIGLRSRIDSRGMYSEEDVRLASVIKDSRAQLPSWQHDGACNGTAEGELFFPERGESTKEAKAVCAGCSVREACLEYALERGEKFGVWGGLSERERRRIRRQRKLAAAASKVMDTAAAIQSAVQAPSPVPEP